MPLTRAPSSLAVAGALLFALGVGAACGGCSDTRPARWSYISPVIMEPSCATASCHSRATAAAGLDFSDADRGYTSLTGLWVWVPNPSSADKQSLHCGTAPNGQPVCDQYFRPLVTPFNPGESRLVNMLRARGATRMPPDRPLNEADIRLIEQWILDGARGDGRERADAAVSDGPRNPSPPDADPDARDAPAAAGDAAPEAGDATAAGGDAGGDG